MKSIPVKSRFLYAALLSGAVLWGCNYENSRSDETAPRPTAQTSPPVAVLAQPAIAETDCKNEKKRETPMLEGLKTIEGTVVGQGSGTYWSNIIIESGGRKYSLEIDSWSPDGKYSDTLPGVQSGKEIPIGTRVRIVSATLAKTGKVDGTPRLTKLGGGESSTSIDRPPDLEARRLILVPIGRTADATRIDGDFKSFISELVSAVHNRDQAAIKSVMHSAFEVSFPPYEIQPAALFHELDRDVVVNCDRPNCLPISGTAKAWDSLDEALGTGTRPYKDAEPGRIVRITNSFNNTLFFEYLCDGKWHLIRYLGYPAVVKPGR